jgi:hypothetical protein
VLAPPAGVHTVTPAGYPQGTMQIPIPRFVCQSESGPDSRSRPNPDSPGDSLRDSRFWPNRELGIPARTAGQRLGLRESGNDSEKRPGPGPGVFAGGIIPGMPAALARPRREDEARDDEHNEEPAVQMCTQVSDDRDGPSQHRPDHRFPKLSRTAGDDHAVAGLYGFY